MSVPWKRMTEAQKARYRERARIYRNSPKGRAKTLARKRKWNAENRERKRARDRAWYARKKKDAAWMADYYAVKEAWKERNAEKYAESQKAWHAAHPGYFGEHKRKWREANSERVKEYNRSYYERNRERILAYKREYNKTHKDTRKNRNRWQRMKLVFARDAAKYAAYREYGRNYHMRRVEREGRDYVPRFSTRIPDHVPFGVSSAFAARSAFIYENHDRERQREFNGFAREVAIDRRNRKAVNA